MKSSKISLIALVSASLLLSACTEPGETTYISSATGGVLGAGLGAIVGNQTGSPGEGLVIGSVAGAGAGAAIGNALEAQQKSIRTQDEAIERQQKMLAAQNAEMRELRNMPRDTDSVVKGAFASEARGSLSYNRDIGAGSMNSESLTDQLNRGADIKNSRPQSFTSPESQIVTRKEFIHPQPVRLQEPQNKRLESPALKEKSLETQAKSVDDTESVLEETNPETTTVTARVKETSSGIKSTECGNADSEAAKAESSKEPADKLFYLRRAIRLCPSNAGFHKRLADEYVELGRNEDAKASYQDALKLDPSSSEAKKSMAAISTNAY